MSPIRIEIDFKKPFAKILINKTTPIVTSDKVKDCKLGSFALSPIFPIATGINVKPIVVITDPVTIGGKKFATLEKMPATKTTYIPEAIKAPNI